MFLYFRTKHQVSRQIFLGWKYLLENNVTSFAIAISLPRQLGIAT